MLFVGAVLGFVRFVVGEVWDFEQIVVGEVGKLEDFEQVVVGEI